MTFSINPDNEPDLEVRHLGMNKRTLYSFMDNFSARLQPTPECWLDVLFKLFGIVDIVQDERYPDYRIGLFDEDMVLRGWLRLGGDHEAKKN